jgi:hypothetical protein
LEGAVIAPSVFFFGTIFDIHIINKKVVNVFTSILEKTTYICITNSLKPKNGRKKLTIKEYY